MKLSGEDHLTIAICEDFWQEASQVVAGYGWKGVEVIAYPARCGQPVIAEEELTILSRKQGDLLVLGGKCLLEIKEKEKINSVVEENCYSLFCGSALVNQLLGDGAFPVSPGWLRRWKHQELGALDNGRLEQLKENQEGTFVLLDTLIEEKTKADFQDFLLQTGAHGEILNTGCDHLALNLYRIVMEWQVQRDQKHLQTAQEKASEATLILNLLAMLEPAVSFDKAGEQLVDLLNMFMSPEQVSVEIISKGVTDFRFAEDNAAISLSAFTASGLYRQDSIRGFYLLVPIDSAKSAVVRISGIHEDDKMNDHMALALSFKGLVRLILYNGILYNDLHAEIVHKTQIEKYLEKSELHFRYLYEHAPLPYHSLDSNGDILAVNKAWLATLGFEKNSVIGSSFEKTLSPESVHNYREFISKVCAGRESMSIELGVIKNDNTPIQIHLDATTTSDSDGKLHQVHCIFVDVSEKNRINELILQSEKLSTIAGLAAGIAHEINTPLSGIMQSAQLIEMFLNPSNEQSVKAAADCGVDLNKVKDYAEKQDLHYFIEGIRNSVVTASEIIKNLLEFSRPSKGEWVSVRLAHLLDRIVKLILSDYDLKKKYSVINVKFETDYDPNVPFVYCVSVEIEQVFFNIIKNAVHALGKAQTAEPKITIRTRLKKNNAQIEIEDNGPGIEAEAIKHVFDPFFTTKAPGEGTGLGLSISYAIVAGKHNGLILVDPDYDEGTRFLVELPVDRGQRKDV